MLKFPESPFRNKNTITSFKDAVHSETPGLQHSLICNASRCPRSISQRMQWAKNHRSHFLQCGTTMVYHSQELRWKLFTSNIKTLVMILPARKLLLSLTVKGAFHPLQSRSKWEFGQNKGKQQLGESALLVFWKKKKKNTVSTKRIIILCSLCFPATFQENQKVEVGTLSRNNIIKTKQNQ